MKVFGWICIVLGTLSLFGAISAGDSAFGPLFWLGFGIVILYYCNQKEDNKENRTFSVSKPQQPSIILSDSAQTAEDIRQKTYWETFKESNPTKAREVENLLGLDLSLLSDIDVREKIETLERLSKSMNCSISEIKENYLKEIEKYSSGLLPQMIESTRSQMAREVDAFHIKQENTASALMMKWLEEKHENLGASDAMSSSSATEKEMEIAKSYFPHERQEDIIERIKSLREMVKIYNCPIEDLKNFYKNDVMKKYDGKYENFHFLPEAYKYMANQAYEIAPKVLLKPANTSYGIMCEWLSDIMKCERKKFVDNEEIRCPYCQSSDIELDMFSDEFICNSCKKSFGGI